MCCWPRCTGPSSTNAAFALHLPLRCARFPVVRPWLYHGVGAPTAPLRGSDSSLCPTPKPEENASQIHPNRCGAEYPTIWAPLLEHPGSIGGGRLVRIVYCVWHFL